MRGPTVAPSQLASRSCWNCYNPGGQAARFDLAFFQPRIPCLISAQSRKPVRIEPREDVMKAIVAAAALALATAQAHAESPVTYTVEQSFDDVVFGLENAVIDRGLVIDSVSHTGEMLERTKADVGSDKTIFVKADVFSFCSAALSRKVMEADPMNVQFCPYDIFVLQFPDSPDQTTIGYRKFPDGPMKEVEALLDGIARDAVGMD